MSKNPVTDISVTYNVALVTVDNLPNNLKIISDIFNSIAEQKISIDMISQAPPYRGVINISFSISADDLVKTLSILNSFKKVVPNLNIEVDSDNTKLSVYGESMKNLPGVAAALFTILASNGIEIKLVTTSEVDISYLIYEKDVDRAIEAIKNKYDIT
ncbi:MAG: ACT domain-containing protein [Clostridia bacterium]|nr:ACT domain-containing protein [Clostridia bacterium]